MKEDVNNTQQKHTVKNIESLKTNRNEYKISVIEPVYSDDEEAYKEAVKVAIDFGICIKSKISTTLNEG